MNQNISGNSFFNNQAYNVILTNHHHYYSPNTVNNFNNGTNPPLPSEPAPSNPPPPPAESLHEKTSAENSQIVQNLPLWKERILSTENLLSIRSAQINQSNLPTVSDYLNMQNNNSQNYPNNATYFRNNSFSGNSMFQQYTNNYNQFQPALYLTQKSGTNSNYLMDPRLNSRTRYNSNEKVVSEFQKFTGDKTCDGSFGVSNQNLSQRINSYVGPNYSWANVSRNSSFRSNQLGSSSTNTNCISTGFDFENHRSQRISRLANSSLSPLIPTSNIIRGNVRNCDTLRSNQSGPSSTKYGCVRDYYNVNQISTSQIELDRRRRATFQFIRTDGSSRNCHTTKDLQNNVGNISQTGVERRNKFLNFTLEDSPKDVPQFKINDTESIEFRIISETSELSKHSSSFSQSVDSLSSSSDKEAVVSRAKRAVVISRIFGQRGYKSVERIISRRFTDDTSSITAGVEKQMRLLYLIHVIMAVETVNDNWRCDSTRPLCQTFEAFFSKKSNHALEKLATQLTKQQKHELFSIRCRWKYFFTAKGLLAIDHLFSFAQEVVEDNISSPTVTVIEIDDLEDDDTDDVDNLIGLKEILDVFLQVNWLTEFPISKQEKKGFAEKYYVEKSSGKDKLYLFDKSIEFNSIHLQRCIELLIFSKNKTKEDVIVVVKEAFFVENIFGKNKIADFVNELTKRISLRPLCGNPLLMQECLMAFILTHITLCVEATKTIYEKEPKIIRPFCNAFSTDNFATNFRHFTTTLTNKNNRQRMYYMRLSWNSCLLDGCLSKIDANNFWKRVGVRQNSILRKVANVIELDNSDGEEVAIIACIDKNEIRDDIATVALTSSEDEGRNSEHCHKEDEEIVATGVVIHGQSSVAENQGRSQKRRKRKIKRLTEAFHELRRTYWIERFSMEDSDIAKLKYKYEQKCAPKSMRTHANELKNAISVFQKTLLSTIPPITGQTILKVAKEAFFIEAEFGQDAVQGVAQFLLVKMQKGFNMGVADKWQWISQLVTFLVVHAIVAIESVEPLMMPNVTDRCYKDVFKHASVPSLLKTSPEYVLNADMKAKLDCLAATWLHKDHGSTIGSIISKKGKMCFHENTYTEELINYLNIKFSSIPKAVDSTKGQIRTKKRKRRRQILDDSDDDNEKGDASIVRRAVRRLDSTSEEEMKEESDNKRRRFERLENSDNWDGADSDGSVNTTVLVPTNDSGADSDESVNTTVFVPRRVRQTVPTQTDKNLDTAATKFFGTKVEQKRIMAEYAKKAEIWKAMFKSDEVGKETTLSSNVKRKTENVSEMEQDYNLDSTDINSVKLSPTTKTGSEALPSKMCDELSEKEKDSVRREVGGSSTLIATKNDSIHPNQVQIIQNFDTEEFLNTLLQPSLKDIEIVYINGVAQAKIIYDI